MDYFRDDMTHLRVPVARKAEAGEEPYEYVDHPKHYNSHPAGIECIAVIEDLSFNVGAAIKHLWRVGLKPGSDADQDLAKAIWYLERERERLKRRLG